MYLTVGSKLSAKKCTITVCAANSTNHIIDSNDDEVLYICKESNGAFVGELLEFYPQKISMRDQNSHLAPKKKFEDQYADQLQKFISKYRVDPAVDEVFEANGTCYALSIVHRKGEDATYEYAHLLNETSLDGKTKSVSKLPYFGFLIFGAFAGFAAGAVFPFAQNNAQMSSSESEAAAGEIEELRQKIQLHETTISELNLQNQNLTKEGLELQKAQELNVNKIEELEASLAQAQLASPEITELQSKLKSQEDALESMTRERDELKQNLQEFSRADDTETSSAQSAIVENDGQDDIEILFASNPQVFGGLSPLQLNKIKVMIVSQANIEDILSSTWPSLLKDQDKRDAAKEIICEKFQTICITTQG